ncbi:MAG: SurA N-terminal domain-containing protein [Fimbriimonadaceae bacterium]|nr:SurA N-terminal domain-containing protein [Alphaproteobacteria bacterium]
MPGLLLMRAAIVIQSREIMLRQTKKFNLILLWAFSCLVLLAIANTPLSAQTVQGVAVLVNDEPISNFDIEQRMKLMRASTGKPANSRMREEVIEQLIDETLKLQEARRLNISVSDEQIDESLGQMAAGSRMSLEQFKGALKRTGINIVTLRNRVAAEISWREIVRARFQRSVRVREQDVEREMGQRGNVEETTRTDFKLQQILLLVRPGSPNSVVNSRMNEAQLIRRDFTSCGSSRSITVGMRDIVIKDLGTVSSSTLPPAAQTELANLQVGGITTPQMSQKGIILLGVCGREEVTDNSQARATVQNELMNQEFSNLALRHLRDLRQDAVIERR